MSQENNGTEPPKEAVATTTANTPVEASDKPHEIKMAESYLEEKLNEFFLGKETTSSIKTPGPSMLLNSLTEDSGPTNILNLDTLQESITPDADVNYSSSKVSVRSTNHSEGHPVNINTICLFACKTVEEFNKASNFMMSGIEKLNAAQDVVEKVLDKVVVFVPENQRREFSKNIHHGIHRVSEIIEFIVEISKYPNWINSERWIMNTLDDLKPRCRFIPWVDRGLKNKIAKRKKESQELLAAEKKTAKEERVRLDKIAAQERAEAEKKAKEELKAKKQADQEEKKRLKEELKAKKASVEGSEGSEVTTTDEVEVEISEGVAEVSETERIKEEIRKMQQTLAEKEKLEEVTRKERKEEERKRKEEERKRKEEEIKKLKDELKKL